MTGKSATGFDSNSLRPQEGRFVPGGRAGGVGLTALLLFCGALGWSEEVLIVEQDYTLVEQDKSGAASKDIRQKLYLAKEWLRIDEFAGPGKVPSETYLIDFKKQEVVNLDNENLTKTTEKFEDRRKRIDLRKINIQRDLRNLPDGPQKEKTRRLYRCLLDDEREFKVARGDEAKGLDKEAPQSKEILSAKCKLAIVYDNKEKDFQPLRVYHHPELRVDYDSAEVLYLLQLIGKNLAQYLQENKKTFHLLPMEMHLILAAGGTLDTKVVSIQKVDSKDLDPKLRDIPEDFKEKGVRRPPGAAVSDPGKAPADPATPPEKKDPKPQPD